MSFCVRMQGFGILDGHRAFLCKLGLVLVTQNLFCMRLAALPDWVDG